MKDRTVALKAGDNWSTPKKLYDYLDQIYHFDFDPCPLFIGEMTPEHDGLLKEWGKSNFVNPPYSLKLKTNFVMKGLEESKKDKRCVFLIPSVTGSILFHEQILPNASEIILVKGRIPFVGENTFGEIVTTKCGMHDSMIVVFDVCHKTACKWSTIVIKEILAEEG